MCKFKHKNSKKHAFPHFFVLTFKNNCLTLHRKQEKRAPKIMDFGIYCCRNPLSYLPEENT